MFSIFGDYQTKIYELTLDAEEIQDSFIVKVRKGTHEGVEVCWDLGSESFFNCHTIKELKEIFTKISSAINELPDE